MRFTLRNNGLYDSRKGKVLTAMETLAVLQECEAERDTAYDEGYTDGKEDTHQASYEDGYTDGYNAGKSEVD